MAKEIRLPVTPRTADERRLHDVTHRRWFAAALSVQIVLLAAFSLWADTQWWSDGVGAQLLAVAISIPVLIGMYWIAGRIADHHAKEVVLALRGESADKL